MEKPHNVIIEDRIRPENGVVTEGAVKYEIRRLMGEGVYHQDELFRILYPVYFGHYSRLREIIAEEKNRG